MHLLRATLGFAFKRLSQPAMAVPEVGSVQCAAMTSACVLSLVCVAQPPARTEKSAIATIRWLFIPKAPSKKR